MTQLIRRLLLVFLTLPLLTMLVAATSVNFAKGPYGGGITLDWLHHAFVENQTALVRSLALALLATACTFLLGAPLAWAIARGPRRLGQVLAQLADLPLAMPGIALSIALVGLYAPMRASGLLLLCGHVLYTMPFMVVSLIPAFRDPELLRSEEAARSVGASWWFALRTVTLPSASTAIVQGCAMTMALSMGEFNVSFFVVPPAIQTAPFALFSAYTTGRLEVAAAQTVLFVLAVIPAVWIITRFDGGAWRPVSRLAKEESDA